MRWPMAVLAAMCLGIGLLAPLAVYTVLPAVRVMAPAAGDSLIEPTASVIRSLAGIIGASTGLLLLAVVLFLVRRRLPRAREEAVTGTWDCGYARPTPRMQYTASSFAQPLTDLFRIFLETRKHGTAVHGFFPKEASFGTDTPDTARERLFAPLFRGIDHALAPIRKMQHGRIHEYLLYIAIVLVLLLLWKAGGRQ
ncbi:MAG: hypothetical protein A2Y76_05400 [Planctomycetes bacterium RBG_13_60_9]|nr:MAG: hypothetical protein A2Y76_05400 [Planctomycetes bacterium RBG_13_60_9]